MLDEINKKKSNSFTNEKEYMLADNINNSFNNFRQIN